jgi:hypothetical protein
MLSHDFDYKFDESQPCDYSSDGYSIVGLKYGTFETR